MRGGTIVRRARRKAGITQAELARRLGTTQSVVARWEGGKVSPTIATLSRIAEACGSSLDVKLGEPNEHDLGLALINLRFTPAQRFERFLAGVRFAKELRDASRPTS
jgi:transcriptional regulator with XRE-family HTH domain